MDITSYLLGKKASGGGGDTSEYFKSVDSLEGYPAQALINKFPYAIDLKNRTDISSLFVGFRNIEEIIIIGGNTLTNIGNAFTTCNKLQILDIRDMTLTNNPSGYGTLLGTNSGNRVPYNCLIIVKDQLHKDWFATYYVDYTNVKTVDEYNAL